MSRDNFQNGGTFYSQSIGVINTMKNMSGTIEAVQHNRYSYNWILLNIKHKSEESEDNMVEATSNTVIVYSVFWCKHSKS